MAAHVDRPAVATSDDRTLHPYGYCRYCGRPRPQGSRFCGAEECEVVAGRLSLPAAAPAVAPPTQGRSSSRVATRRGKPAARRLGPVLDVGGTRDVRRQLLRDTSVLLVVASLLLALVGVLVPRASSPQAGVLAATARPAAAPAAPASRSDGTGAP